jgi:hypothetical protein
LLIRRPQTGRFVVRYGPLAGCDAEPGSSHLPDDVCQGADRPRTVAEIWRAFGLKPWREDSFKVSPDPQLIEKVRDLVGM